MGIGKMVSRDLDDCIIKSTDRSIDVQEVATVAHRAPRHCMLRRSVSEMRHTLGQVMLQAARKHTSFNASTATGAVWTLTSNSASLPRSQSSWPSKGEPEAMCLRSQILETNQRSLQMTPSQALLPSTRTR